MATYLLATGPWNADGTEQLAGLSPTWAGYFSAVTGMPLSPPAIAPMETWIGGYSTMVDKDACGMISWGSTMGGTPANPLYSFVPSINQTTFPLFDSDGTPLTGQVAGNSVVWVSLEDTVTGVAPVVTPTFVEFGHGCYGVRGWADTYVGTLFDVEATPLSQSLLLSQPQASAGTPLEVTILSTLPILPNGTLQVQVTDPSGLNRTPLLTIAYPAPTSRVDVVHNGTQYTSDYYAQSNATLITNGLSVYTIRRAGGFPNTSFTVTAYALAPQ